MEHNNNYTQPDLYTIQRPSMVCLSNYLPRWLGGLRDALGVEHKALGLGMVGDNAQVGLHL